MRRALMTALATAAIGITSPAMAAVTVTTTTGTPLSYQIFGIKSTGNPVYGSSPTNTTTPNVTYTGNVATTMDIKNGNASIGDADAKNPTFNALIVDPTQYDFNEMKFAFQLTGPATVDVYYLLAGSLLNADDFASYTTLAGSITQPASSDNNYLISGANFTGIMLRITTPDTYFFEFKQNNYSPLDAPPPPVPEPATWGMMLLGFAGMGMAMRRSRRRSGTLMQIA
jgi:hypothetical protein